MGRRKLPEQDKQTFGTWYDDNGEGLNEMRSEKYKNDPTYRAKAKEASRKNYRAKRGILPTGERLLMSEGEVFVCLKISRVTDLLGVPPQSILRYINLGFFPEMKFDGTKIKYITVDQVPLLRKFFNAVEKSGSHKGSVRVVADKLGDYLSSNWRNRYGSQKIIAKEG